VSCETSSLELSTSGRGFLEFTHAIHSSVKASGISNGLCHVFLQHTSASLLITENADPDVLCDLERFLSDLVPDGDAAYLHRMEGPDDMPAHIRSILTCSELTIPIRHGRLALGTWQGVYLWEHRLQPHRRRVELTFVGGA
jgi:secondary thiamine-phosphate synthase enzyme